MRRIAIVLLALEPMIGCAKVCEDVDPSFQLDIRYSTGVASIEVTIDLGGSRYQRTFDLEGQLDDGMTSLVVTLEPEMSASFEAQVGVVAYSGESGQGGVIAAGEQTYAGTPDGCNRFELELTPVVDDPSCEQTCSPMDCNSACDASCDSCSFACSSKRRCISVCSGRSTCDVSCDSVGECRTDCDEASDCDIECNGTAACLATCRRGSRCRLACEGSAICNFDCNGNQSTCPDGSIVCNRDCP